MRNKLDGSTFRERTFAMPELRKWEKKAKDRIAAAIEVHRAAPDPYEHFLFHNRTRREIALLSASVWPARQAFVPYLSPDLASFCLSLPRDFTQNGCFHDRVIAHSFPNFLIGYANGRETRWRRQGAIEKLRSVGEALVESAKLGMANLAGEPTRLFRAAQNPTEAQLYVWRAYRSALNAVSSPAKARRFLVR